MEQLQRQVTEMDQLRRRVDELEAAQRTARPAPSPPPARTAAAPPRATRATPVAPAPAPIIVAEPPPAPVTARVTRADVDEAMRGSMPNSWRIPGTETSVRLYGFIKANMYGDIDVLNRSDAPSVQGIPLAGSAADQRSGDLSFSARRSRIGFDTQTPTPWGPLTTKLEMDFAGDQPSPSGAATSSGYMPRLRQAYVEVGGEQVRLLIGQANSLWNEGLFETLTDSTFLNASAVRQAQVRLSGRLAQGLTGQVSLEAPYTDYTSSAGVFYPDSNLNGGASPATNQVPDLLGRLTYRRDLGDLELRGLVRQLRIDTNGTAASPTGSGSTVGWGLATNGKLNMRELWTGFGHDQLIGMASYGQGIGRYFDATSSGQSAFSDIGLAGVSSVSLNAIPSWGVAAGYRHFWMPTLRSTVGYAYARIDSPGYVAAFTPGSSAAQSVNNDMQMGVVNLIWSPFARESGGTLSNGSLDLGIEYIYYRRDLQGGSTAAGAGQFGQGIEQRIQAAAIARF
ncbi:DcaP family trimeric outer membrane transporter [Humitalea sp. 24SJ18S-53]|uniref:DcaP family trimeric outer membrane transporter n=1 Tax=Humitalea sp. 24SJ18S-53 TaxID=3422307 RepID=UPI003D66CDB5